jgi:hypothetical protein
MTDHVAPQEDHLLLPTSWTAALLPRRGKRAGKPVEPAAPELVERRRREIDERADDLRAAIADRKNEPFAAAVEAFLDGEPDPRGAAAVAALLCDPSDRHRVSLLRPDVDLWLLGHGLPFAVAAAVERLAILEGDHGYHWESEIRKRHIAEDHPGHPHHLLEELDHGGLAAVRTLLAAASDAEYAAVVAAVAPHRDSPMKRLAAMILLPDEHAWVREACADYRAARTYAVPDRIVWHTVSDPEQTAAAGLTAVAEFPTDIEVVAAVLDGLGTSALPFLIAAAPADEDRSGEFRKLVYRAISLVPTDEATTCLLEHLDSPYVFSTAVDTAARFPVRTLRVAARLAPTARGDRRSRLAAVAALPGAELRVHLSDADRTALNDLLDHSGRVPEAALADLPPLLAAPPWTRKRPKAKPIVIDGLEPPAGRIDWAEGEKEAWSGLGGSGDLNVYLGQALDAAPDLDPRDWGLARVLAYGEAAEAEPLLERWQGLAHSSDHIDLQRILARFGDRVTNRILGVAAADHQFQALPGPVLNRAAARIAAERLARLKAARPSALAWFDRHGLAAVPFLVPDALGADKRRRRYAETALAHLALRLGAGPVAARAEPHGPEAAAAVASLVDGDPLDPHVKPPKPGPWAVPAMLPQVLLSGGERALPAASVRYLVTVLALATPDYPYPGLDVVAEACDRDSLTRFSRALFEQWLSVDAPVKDSWALTQLAHFADDVTVWALAALVREWPGQSRHKRAVAGLRVLGAIGTETALRAIQGIAEKVPFKALKQEARAQIAAIAAGLGLSRDELADRLVPDFGLGDAAVVLDYGTRTFTVAFDEQLRPYVTDADGKPRKSLPKPGAKDDPELAEDAYRRFTALKKELRAVAAEQVTRLEAAMVAGRSWSEEEFRRYFAEHALTKHLARRLVWLAEVDDRSFAFRIAEDGTFGDVEDERVDLTEAARVRVAHPVHLGPEQVAAWTEILADYEILQPFAQLHRPVMAFTPEEIATGRLDRFEGSTVATGRLLGMAKRGWKRADPVDGGVSPGVAYALPGGGHVVVELEPGIYAGGVHHDPEQRLTAVTIRGHEQYRHGGATDPDRPTAIDPVAAAEALAGLARLTGKS